MHVSRTRASPTRRWKEPPVTGRCVGVLPPSPLPLRGSQYIRAKGRRDAVARAWCTAIDRAVIDLRKAFFHEELM
jgi:hypothetical protein